jgi:DNA polymerase-3 subunit alpha
MEAYVSSYRGDDPEEKKKHRSANHLLLIARTMEGFENIIKIHNDAQINGFYYTPRANREAFEKWGRGIIASSACLAGEITQYLAAGEKDKALEAYQFYSRVFDRFYIEIQMIEFGQQQEANKLLIQFAKEVGAPMMCSLDSHYLEPEHAETHDVLLCIRQHKTMLDEEGDENADVWNFDVRNLYYRNLPQIQELYLNGFVENGEQKPPFKDDIFTDDVFAEAVWNTHALAMEIEDIKLDSAVKLPKLYDNSADILRDKMNEGFLRRGLDKLPNYQEYVDRLQFEYGVIVKLGFTDYFLIVEDMVSYAVKKFGEFSVGLGRGSVGGSLAAYCLGITGVDPIKYGLLFERFISEERGSITACGFEL